MAAVVVLSPGLYKRVWYLRRGLLRSLVVPTRQAFAVNSYLYQRGYVVGSRVFDDKSVMIWLECGQVKPDRRETLV